MNYIFDVFFEDALSTLNRNGLQTRQARRDMIDRLNSIVGGCAAGEQGTAAECASEAVTAAIEYHRRYKSENLTVSLNCCLSKWDCF